MSDEWLSSKEYLKILRNPDLNKCISVPPISPSPGELYVYRNETKAEDRKADFYRWRLKGHKAIPRSNPNMVCKYYETYHGSGFKKRVYCLYSSPSTVLIHY